MKQTYTFEGRDSTLMLVAKGYDLKDRPVMPVEVGNELSNYPQMLEFFQKFYNSCATLNHTEAETFFIKALGDILMQIDPNKFKDAVYDSCGVNFSGARIPTLLECIINKIRRLPIDILVLDFFEVVVKSPAVPVIDLPKFKRGEMI